MAITARFIKGITRDTMERDNILQDGVPQIALIGRSNVGKSSLINILTQQKGLAKTSSFPGRTQEINLFLINNKWYLVDVPGYGFARRSGAGRDALHELINWYLFVSPAVIQQAQKKIVLIIDANVGPTDEDIEMLDALVTHHKEVIVVANKIDKIKKSDYTKQMQHITARIGAHRIVLCSAQKKIGIGALMHELTQ